MIAGLLGVLLAVSLAPAIASAQAGAWQVADSVIIDAPGLAPVLSPDGRWVAGLKDLDTRQLCVWKVSNGDERCNEESERVADASIAWSPDSQQVAYSQNGSELDSDVFVLDVRSNSLTNLTEDNVDDLKAAGTASQFVIYDEWPVWSPDGEELVFLRILNPRDDNAQRQISVSRVILETGQVVRGQDLVTDEPLEFVAEVVGVITPPVWIGEGTIAFAIRGGRDITGIYTAEVGGGPPQKIDTDPSIPASSIPLLIGADSAGERVVLYWLWGDFAIDGEFYAFGWVDLESGEVHPIEIDVPRRMVIAAPPRLSPDGLSVIYGITGDEATHQDSTIVVQDLETGDTVDVAEGVNLQFWESVRGVEWTADNQFTVPRSDGTIDIVTLEQP